MPVLPREVPDRVSCRCPSIGFQQHKTDLISLVVQPHHALQFIGNGFDRYIATAKDARGSAISDVCRAIPRAEATRWCSPSRITVKVEDDDREGNVRYCFPCVPFHMAVSRYTTADRRYRQRDRGNAVPHPGRADGLFAKDARAGPRGTQPKMEAPRWPAQPDGQRRRPRSGYSRPTGATRRPSAQCRESIVYGPAVPRARRAVQGDADSQRSHKAGEGTYRRAPNCRRGGRRA